MGAGTREAERLARQQEESIERKQQQTLTPCPFCGGEAQVIVPSKGFGMSVGCTQCGADIMRVDETSVTSPDKAIEAWNHRVPFYIGFDPASPDGDRTVKTMHLKRGNVVRERATGQKLCLHQDKKLSDAEWEFVCDRPHSDGDYSYLCNNEYCRCWQ